MTSRVKHNTTLPPGWKGQSDETIQEGWKVKKNVSLPPGWSIPIEITQTDEQEDEKKTVDDSFEKYKN
jgi:hypothetical protein